jgi:hypothetical protein
MEGGEVTMNTSFVERVAWITMRLLVQMKAMHYTTGMVFYMWQRGERIIIAFDPSAIKLERVNDAFVHNLSTRLEGRRVVRTNSRGLFLQVGFDTPRVPLSLDESAPLDLSQQPSAWHLPVGMTQTGPLWVSLTSGISFLIGGATGSGKTGEEHAWIQALLHGGKTLVYAWDGKHSVEFVRYADRPNFHLMFKIEELEELHAMLKDRVRKLSDSGSVNIQMHNEAHPDDFVLPIALFVDEAADMPDAAKILLQRLISIYRFAGLYPIITTNQPTQAEMFKKTNLSTRVAFRVPHHNDSITMLGYKGAEALPGERGRGLITWRSRLVEFQSFRVTYPPVSEAARQLLAERVSAETEAELSLGTAAQEEDPAEKVKQLHAQGKSNTAIVYAIWGKSGSSFSEHMKQVKEILATASTATASMGPHSPDLGPVAG